MDAADSFHDTEGDRYGATKHWGPHSSFLQIPFLGNELG